MISHLAECYRALESLVPTPLIEAQAGSSVATILGALPDRADTFGFEIRLGAHDPAVDIGIGLSTASGDHAFLATDARDLNLRRAHQLDTRWLRIREFAGRWAAPKSSWLLRVPFMFLEFDSDGLLFPAPVPSVFLGLDWPIDELSFEARQPGRDGGWHSTPGFKDAVEMIRTLRRIPLTPRTETLLARSFATVPDGGLILHLAVMLGRPGEAVRISAMAPRQDARDYLLSLGWKDGLDQFDRTLDAFGPHSDFVSPYAPIQIDLDVGENIGPTIGIMLQPAASDRWPDLLDALVRENLCAQQKRDGLLAWPGSSAVEVESEGNVYPWILERTLSHAKVACSAGVPSKAKAYFGVTPRLDVPT